MIELGNSSATQPPSRWLVPQVLTGAALMALAVPAAAQDTADSGPLGPLKACQATTDSAARLACYDRAAGAMIAANDAGDLKVLDREEVRKTRRGLFGFALPSLKIFGDGDAGEEREEDRIEVLNTTIASVGRTMNGFVITTAEGAQWELDKAPRMSPKIGQPVEIRNAAMSAFYVKVNGQPGVKGRRTR